MKIVLVTFTCFVIAGCEALRPIEYGWYKQGVSKDDTVTVLAECQYKVGMNKVEAYQQQQLITSCMQAAGFRWRPISQ